MSWVNVCELVLYSIVHETDVDFLSLQSPDIMCVVCRDPVGSLLQHHALQGEGAARCQQRQVRHVQGPRLPRPLRRLGRGRTLPRLRPPQPQEDRQRSGGTPHSRK